MEQYLIDTNIVSDYFSASLPESGLLFLDGIVDAIPILSVITQIELLCWNTNKTIEHWVECFVADSIIMDITPDIVRKCVTIRKGKKIKTPDAIIAGYFGDVDPRFGDVDPPHRKWFNEQIT